MTKNDELILAREKLARLYNAYFATLRNEKFLTEIKELEELIQQLKWQGGR